MDLATDDDDDDDDAAVDDVCAPAAPFGFLSLWTELIFGCLAPSSLVGPCAYLSFSSPGSLAQSLFCYKFLIRSAPRISRSL